MKRLALNNYHETTSLSPIPIVSQYNLTFLPDDEIFLQLK